MSTQPPCEKICALDGHELWKLLPGQDARCGLPGHCGDCVRRCPTCGGAKRIYKYGPSHVVKFTDGTILQTADYCTSYTCEECKGSGKHATKIPGR